MLCAQWRGALVLVACGWVGGGGHGCGREWMGGVGAPLHTNHTTQPEA
jgi:hypothetical protein